MANETRHRYESYEGTPLWQAIERAIADLVRNDDIAERTARRYIVGYLCHHIAPLLNDGKVSAITE
jgi:hypothetical protein